MSGSSKKKRLLQDLRDKDARDVFVEAHARTGPAYQIKSMREARGLSQAELGRKIGVGGDPQSTVSRLENPDYGKFNIRTLLKLASALDVGLMVRFVGFGELVRRYEDLSPEALNAASYGEDEDLMDMYFDSIPSDQFTTNGLQICEFLNFVVTELSEKEGTQRAGSSSAIAHMALNGHFDR